VSSPSDAGGVETLKVTTVTGIDLELPLAGPGGRAYAFVVDWHVRVLLALAWWVLFGLAVAGTAWFTGGAASSPSFVLAGVVGLAVYLLYHPVLEWWMDGQTPGKRMARIRIVTRAGGPPSLGAILIRNAFRVVDSLPFVYCVGFIATMVTRDHVRIGDLAAGTVLVYQGPASKKEQRQQRERLEQLAAPTGLAPGLVELVQDLLERWPVLEPAVRERLARGLLERAGVAPGADPRADLAGLLARRAP
jgi:uncharacterized RDD family membrane protein YckC